MSCQHVLNNYCSAWRHRDGTSLGGRQEESAEIALLELVKHASFPGIGAHPAILKTKCAVNTTQLNAW